MNKEFFDALVEFESEKGIETHYLVDKIKSAIIAAVRRGYGVEDNVIVDIDINSHKFYVAIRKEVVENVDDHCTQIQLDEAKRYDKKALVGSFVDVTLKPTEFGLLATQAAKLIIRQSIREAERDRSYSDLKSKVNEIVNAVILKIDKKTKNLTLDLDIGKCQCILPKSEQIESENFKEGDHIKVYVMDIKDSDRGPKVIISRTNPGLVKRLFEMEVPEIQDGLVNIKAVSREAGVRTKLAVYSNDPNVDAVGACIGPKGSRVSEIMNQLNGEKIDIIKYSDNILDFVKETLLPAKVVKTEIIDEEQRIIKAVVPDNQLSLAIGQRGINVKLAVRLIGWKIDINPESGFFGE